MLSSWREFIEDLFFGVLRRINDPTQILISGGIFSLCNISLGFLLSYVQ